MRSKIAIASVVAILTVLIYLIGTRPSEPPDRPTAPPPRRVRAESTASSVVEPSTASSVTALSSAVPFSSEASTPRQDYLLRIVASSWDFVAAALVANGGQNTASGSAIRNAGLDAHIEVLSTAQDVELRLARGGGDVAGADVAVMTLPEMVTSYERLRALEPQVVHLIGWSRGRELLLGTREAALSKSFATTSDVTLASDEAAATSLALFALDEAGISPAHVHIVRDSMGVSYVAQTRPLPTARPSDAPSKVLLTTADATRFVPIVAVSTKAFVEGHIEVLSTLLRAWREGATSLRSDVSGSARHLAAEQGAPDAPAILERLGWMSDSGVDDEARALGIAGQDAVTVATLFARNWRLFRDAGVLTSPPPDRAVVSTAPFARTWTAPDASDGQILDAVQPSSEHGTRVLLTRRIDAGDSGVVAADAVWLAGIFERSSIRVSGHPLVFLKDAVTLAGERLGSARERTVLGSLTGPKDGVGVIDVLAGP